MPLKKVIADFGRGVFSPLNKKGNQKNYFPYYQNTTLPNKHIYYEPPEDFELDLSSSLLPGLSTTGEVIVHRTPTSPDSKPSTNERSRRSLPENYFSTKTLDVPADDPEVPSKDQERAYTEEEFTSAILALSQKDTDAADCSSRLDASNVHQEQEDVNGHSDMGDSGIASMVRDPLTTSCQQVNGHDDCDCERKCANPKHSSDCKSGDYAVSPVLERRNKSVLGRLRNFASRTSYSASEDGHSHSSDYEEPDDEKRVEIRFSRDARERSSSSWAGRVRDLHRDVKKRISRLRNSRGATPDEELEGGENSEVAIQPGSSVESIPSGSGSSLPPPTPTSSNRSSTSAGEEDHSNYVGTFIGRARALVDYTPSPYDRDGLAFKKGDIIDIIAKNKTGIWVGMAHGKVGHFKFINVQELLDERKQKRRQKKVSNDLNLSKKPDSLDELLNHLGLQEYTNVLVLNGYDELDTFKEIEKIDLDNLGITNLDHVSKLLRAAEMLQDVDVEEEIEEDESQVKQSPRDSGCYASHENLVQRDSSQRALSNGQFVVDLEDQDTSLSESGIHSREGHETVMNNLDLSAESSGKSTATTMDDVNGAADPNDCAEDRNDVSNFNILPSQEAEPVNQEKESDNVSANGLPSVGDVQPPAMQVCLSEDNASTLSIPYVLTGPKSSPGSPRKVRNKHTRNKSHSHRSKDMFNEFSFNSHSFNFSKYRHISIDACSSHGSYMYGWSSFVRHDNNPRRNLLEYDDVVSEPATEAEDSPGRHMYKKVKQRKGSLQTLIHDTRPPSPTVLSKVSKKLSAEKIYLHEEPYTDKTGFCGIPPALVQRYAEELRISIVDAADALDQVRINSLQQQNRRGVPNDFLSDSCIVPVIEPNYSSLRSWLISLGLPMYEQNFSAAGLSELHHLSSLNSDDLAHLNIRDPYHQVYLEAALCTLSLKLQKRPHTYSQNQTFS